MLLHGRGTRRRPCDSRLECPPRSTSSRLGFYWRPLQKGMHPLQVCEGWLPLSRVITFQCLGYNSLLSLIPGKNADPAPNNFWHFVLSFCLSCLESRCSSSADCPACSANIEIIIEKKTINIKKWKESMSLFCWNGHKHWKNVAFPFNNRQTEPRQKWLSDLKAFSLCLCLIVVLLTSPSLPSICPTVRLVGFLLVKCCWSTRIGPRGVLRNCRATTERPAALWRRASGPRERRGETTCTSQSLCLISLVPLVGFVQLPWSFYGPFGRSPPTQSPEEGEEINKIN